MTAALTGLTFRILFLVGLYIFLGVSVWMLWRTVAAKEPHAGNIAIPSITLSAYEDGQEKVLTFSSADVLIGRDLDCDFVLQHSTVSSRHGRLSYNLNQWWYEDLKSTNGSYLDSLRIEEPIVVKDGDDISCGDIDFRVFIKPLT